MGYSVERVDEDIQYQLPCLAPHDNVDKGNACVAA
jgi:hypothetical protein